MLKTWTREELKEFIDLYPVTEIDVLMEKYGRSRRSIVCLASRLQVRQGVGLRSVQGKRAHLGYTGQRKPRKVWSKAIVEEMLKEYPHKPNKILAEKYGVSRRAIACAANLRGVTKSEEYMISTCSMAGKIANEVMRLRRMNKEQT